MKKETIIKTDPHARGKEMTTIIDRSYQQMILCSGEERDDGNIEHEDSPQDSAVIFHNVPENGKSQWNHIEDLDSFFTRVYYYHQNHGFACMMLQKVFELGQFVFVVVFSVFLFHCVNYTLLFERKKNGEKTWITEALLPSSECLASMGLITWMFIVVSSIFWLIRFIIVINHFIQFLDIKLFFNRALKINDKDLDNLTWHEVQKKVIEVQKEEEMCIHKRELSELDIYHRILRFKNYLVAMVNKSLLPIHLNIPAIGNVIFMTRGLKYNLELLLFWGPWSPFEKRWHLREEYKNYNKRHELARSLSKHILWIGIANFLLCPVIFLWQILYSFFNYGELLKREPGALGTRMWSLYGKLYLRHFNELDHELNARLNRAYRPASKYMSMFTSPLMSVIAKNIAFVCGSIFAVFLILTFYDEDFLNVEHVLMIMTVTGSVTAICRSFIPDENLVWCPESLLTAVLAHTHYRPDSWRNQAHTQTTRAQVAQLFQYRAVHLIEEIVSPLLTPYILCFELRHKALEIVDFYRNFTIEITGVGDICSFAQMDVKRHGNLMWQGLKAASTFREVEANGVKDQAEDGKTELSLIHFTHTNPEWKPPSHAESFINGLRERAIKEVTNIGHLNTNPLYASLTSLSSLGPEYNNIVSTLFRNPANNQTSMPNINNFISNHNLQTESSSSNAAAEAHNFPQSSGITNVKKSDFPKPVRRGAYKVEGPLHLGEKGLLFNLQQIVASTTQSPYSSIVYSRTQDMNNEPTTSELTAVDMSLSTLYLHELHHRQVKHRGYHESATTNLWRHSPQELSTLPELGQERAPLLLHQDSSIRTKTNS